MTELESLRAEVARLTAERDALRPHAKRYLEILQNARYGIQENQTAVLFLEWIIAPDHIGGLSSAIDAARAAKGTK